MHPRWFLFAAAISGFISVSLGAFGAHGLQARFEGLPDGAKRLEWWATAAQYQLVHSVALGLVAVVLAQNGGTSGRVAGLGFLVGILLFSGSLYVMALTGIRALGAVTPLGGLALLSGWGALAVTAARWAR